MNGVELYLKFRRELDEMCVPQIVSELEHIEYIVVDGETVGMVGGDDGYIDVVYVLPEYRRRGLAREAVLSWYERYHTPNTSLDIINNNYTAKQFWNSLFELHKIYDNGISSLYRILSVKPQKGE